MAEDIFDHEVGSEAFYQNRKIIRRLLQEPLIEEIPHGTRTNQQIAKDWAEFKRRRAQQKQEFLARPAVQQITDRLIATVWQDKGYPVK